ncbi:TonB-dependent siderophore receptor [Phenylobacterium sp. J367]|uniref:TonB-dependent receptor plug domain-containing protein n=1 Tax=Phenylobacterium sp. J367 TaxID=2898435 RepID=UPI0021518B11|nr:TonB-dependent receptor [Phenylobacterium sp. J367]MCR5880112.1 TonB-dependent receptor [Phenylobacterium sp. J367]
MDEVVVTGTRRAGVTLTESSTPVDVVSGETLQRQGASDLNDALKTTVVSLNVQKFVAQDASAFVRPFSLRGLPPDQTLVLVNGKRRHRSAVVQITNQPLAAGAQGPDLSAIPAIAVDRIEVLRDGAAAQYGSDAIAGVINFQLKRAREGVTAIARYGQFYEGDGEDYNLQLNVGLRLGEEGFFNVSGELSSSAKTSRGLQRPDAQALINAGNTAVPDPAQRWGAPSVDAARLFFNAELPRDGDGDSLRLRQLRTGLRRVRLLLPPAESRRRVRQRAADQPARRPPLQLHEPLPRRLCAGLSQQHARHGSDGGCERGGLRGTALRLQRRPRAERDRVQTRQYGQPVPGAGLPASFRAGELQQREARLNADFVYPVDTGMFAEPLNVAFGAEYRRETFEIKAGEPASYQAGRFASLADPDTGRIIGLAVGSSGFPGYTPASAGAFSRSNWAAYLDLETEVVDRLTVGAAARYEDFSDFGSTFNWKLTARYELFDGLALRGSVNTGFRAPTPGQSNISDVATNIDPLTGGLLLIATRPPTDPIAQYYGAKPLKEEESKNFAFGAVLDVAGWVLTADYFNIEVKDRIALTSRIPITAADRAALAARGTPAGDLQSVRFFGNFFDTETEGVDVVLSRSWPLDIGKIGLTAAANYTRSKVTNLRDARAVDRERRIEIGRFNPRWRGNVTGTWESGRWNVLLRANYYGEWVDAVPNATPTALSFDQDFGAEWLVDAEVSYQATETFSIAVGADNLLDAYPDKDRRQAQINNGIVYPQFSPFGFNGGFWYVRLTGKF